MSPLRAPAPPVPLDRPIALETALSRARGLLQGARALAMQLGDLGVIDLPPASATPADQSNLRATAVLYLASEVEQAGLISAVETLAGLFASGGVRRIDGAGAQQLHAFWRARRERPARAERLATFARLFGTESDVTFSIRNAQNTGFERAMIDFTEALTAYGRRERDDIHAGETVRIQATADALADDLLTRSGGIGLYLAESLLELIDAAVKILKDPSVQAAVAAQGVWDAVRRIHMLYGERRGQIRVDPHVRRAKAGFDLLTWLADGLGGVRGGSFGGLRPPNEVLQAANISLPASLDLY
jgi:hypothetical protein